MKDSELITPLQEEIEARIVKCTTHWLQDIEDTLSYAYGLPKENFQHNPPAIEVKIQEIKDNGAASEKEASFLVDFDSTWSVTVECKSSQAEVRIDNSEPGYSIDVYFLDSKHKSPKQICQGS